MALLPPKAPEPLRDPETLQQEVQRLERAMNRACQCLVADGQHTMRLLLAQALKGAGFRRVVLAAEGDAAWRILRAQECDLALVDWDLTRLSGPDLLHRVRSDPRLHDLVFIMLTADNLDLTAARAAEEPLDAYLTKPVSPQRLNRRLDLVLDRRLIIARALLAEARGEVDQAVEELINASRNRPRFTWPLLTLGQVLSRAGRWEESEIAFQRALELDPQAVSALVAMGHNLYRRGQPQQARLLYRRALEANPQFLRAYDVLADSLAAEGEVEAALEVLEMALRQQGGENAERQRRLGQLRLETGRYQQAEAAFGKALQLTPGRDVAVGSLNLAQARLAQDLYDPAVQALDQAVEASFQEAQPQTQVKAMLLLGTAHLRFDHLERAEQVFKDMARPKTWPGGQAPLETWDLHCRVGGAYLRERYYEQASDRLKESLAASGGDPEAQAEVRRLCEEVGLPHMAEEAISQAEQWRRDEVARCVSRALGLVQRGLLAEAERLYLRALELEPSSGRVRFNLGRLYLRWGRRDQGLQLLAQAARLGLAGQDWEMVVELARALHSLGLIADAEAALAKVLEARPGLASAQEALGEMQRSRDQET